MMKHRKTGDAMLDPFPPHLSEFSEGGIISGRGVAVELSRFASHRLQAYGSLLEKLARCKSVLELIELQRLFLEDAQHDYLNEGSALVAAATLTEAPAFANTGQAPAP